MNELKYKKIDDDIQDGYGLILENKQLEGCDKWLESWENIKEIIAETNAKDVF